MSINIKSKRLYLRNYEENDIHFFHLLKTNEQVWKFSTNLISQNFEETYESLSNIIKDYENNKPNFQALFIEKDNVYIGEAGIISQNEKYRKYVIGYNLLPEYWNMGYASEITKELVKDLFENKNAERLEALVIERNIASKKVLEKCGFQLEGILRNFAHKDNNYFNVHYYGMIKDDFK